MPPKAKKEGASKKQVAEKTKKVVEVGDRKTCVICFDFAASLEFCDFQLNSQ